MTTDSLFHDMDVFMNSTFTVAPISDLSVLAAFDLTSIAFFALAVVVLTLVMRSTGKRIQQSRANQGASAGERYQELQQQSKAMRDVGDVMLELDKLARHVQGQLDLRFAKLETVIRDADKRIESLSGLMSQTKHKPSLDITLESENPFAKHIGSSNSDAASNYKNDRYSSIYHLSDEGYSAEEIAHKVDQSTGEVELILAIRKTKTQADVVTTKNSTL